MTIRIHEIYRSIQGESTYAGLPCTFVRTTGCDLRCVWCDTEDAFYGGEAMELAEVVERVKALGCPLVEITGGEPLLQQETPELAKRLLAEGFRVLCETGGHRDISVLPAAVVRIMDVKCPGSGEEAKNCWQNMTHLNAADEVKFVVRDRADFDYAVGVVERYQLSGRVRALLFSPVAGACDFAELAAWVGGLSWPEARINLQLHKVIWNPEMKGV